MSGHYLRKRARSAGWAWSLAAFALALLLVSLVFFRLAAIDLQVFALSVLAVAIMVGLALLTSLFAMSRAWWRGDRGGGRAVAAFALAAILAVPFVFGASLAIEYPAGAVAQTDGLAVPATLANGTAATPDLLLGRDYRATAAEVYSVSRNVLEDSGWQVDSVEASAMPVPAEGDLGVSGLVTAPIPTLRDTLPADPRPETEMDPYAAIDSDSYVIEAVARMPVLALTSDFTIRIVEEGGQTFVDVRSASRDLPRDLGQNRRFIEGFFARLDEAMELLRTGPVES